MNFYLYLQAKPLISLWGCFNICQISKLLNDICKGILTLRTATLCRYVPAVINPDLTVLLVSATRSDEIRS